MKFDEHMHKKNLDALYRAGYRRGKYRSGHYKITNKKKVEKIRRSRHKYHKLSRIEHDHKYRKPRFTGHRNVNINADAPKTRFGWLLAIIVICILIFVIPYLLVQSLGLSMYVGINGVTRYLEDASAWWVNKINTTIHSIFTSQGVMSDWLYTQIRQANDAIASWIRSWAWWL